MVLDPARADRWNALMKHSLLRALLATALFSGPLAAAESVLLADPDVKLGLKIEASTVSKNGRTVTTGAGGSNTRSVDITRTRQLQRTMAPDATGGEVTYRILKDHITTVVDGKKENTTAPLDGKVATGLRNGAGNWTFTLADGTATGEAVEQLEILAGFENRRWLPNRKVEVGESWNFAPNFIRASLKRDIPNPQVMGTMKLRQIGKAPDGTRQAIIDCFIRGGGQKELPQGGGAQADGGLTGNLTVNLDQPGRMRFHLVGKLATGAEDGSGTARAMMPLTLTLKTDPLGK